MFIFHIKCQIVTVSLHKIIFFFFTLQILHCFSAPSKNALCIFCQMTMCIFQQVNFFFKSKKSCMFTFFSLRNIRSFHWFLPIMYLFHCCRSLREGTPEYNLRILLKVRHVEGAALKNATLDRMLGLDVCICLCSMYNVCLGTYLVGSVAWVGVRTGINLPGKSDRQEHTQPMSTDAYPQFRVRG